jgi:radical SAM superfamily enzyme YgiQ (UPF0313 family)
LAKSRETIFSGIRSRPHSVYNDVGSRFRSNESVVDELLRLKARARSEDGQMVVFFIDDNFAINVKRTKSLLRAIIAANAQVHWVAQISANLLRDEEFLDLIAASGAGGFSLA